MSSIALTLSRPEVLGILVRADFEGRCFFFPIFTQTTRNFVTLSKRYLIAVWLGYGQQILCHGNQFSTGSFFQISKDSFKSFVLFCILLVGFYEKSME